MEIVTQEQINKLDVLIEKYEHPAPIVETVAGKRVTIENRIDVFPLKKEREKLISTEICKNVVEAASAFLKISPNTFKSKDFLLDSKDVFYFDCIYFMEPASIKRFAKDNINRDI